MAEIDREAAEQAAAVPNTGEEAQLRGGALQSASVAATQGRNAGPLDGLSRETASAAVGSLGLTRGGSTDMP